MATGVGNDSKATVAEIIALLMLVGIVGGLLLPKAFFVSLDRAIFLWLLCCISSGIIQSLRGELDWRFVSKASAASAISVSGSFVGFIIVRAIVTTLQNPDRGALFIPFGSGMMLDVYDPIALLIYSVLLMICFVATFIATMIAAFASRLLLVGAVSLTAFGAEGVERVSRLIAGIVALIAVLLGLWSAFGDWN